MVYSPRQEGHTIWFHCFIHLYRTEMLHRTEVEGRRVGQDKNSFSNKYRPVLSKLEGSIFLITAVSQPSARLSVCSVHPSAMG
jgi:hypothetical protein